MSEKMVAPPDAGPNTGAGPQEDNNPEQSQPAKPPKKLTGTELKAQKQAEKAKRRAAAIAAKEAAAPPGTGAAPPQGVPTGGGTKGGQPKTEHKRSGSTNAPALGRTAAARRLSAGGSRPAVVASEKEKEKDARSTIPECFSHLPMAKRIQLSEADKDVHPAILAIGQQMASFTLRENIARLEATLLALKKVIESYETPPKTTFSRHFVPHKLNKQIEYLTECRPMCFAMGNAVRLLKAKVSQLDIDMPDDEAIKTLCESIDGFMQERIRFAETVITRNAAELITDGDCILTYGDQRLVRKALEKAWSDGVRFEIAVIDDPYDQTGKDLAKSLRQHGLQVSYYPQLGGLTCNLQRATKVFLGAEAIFANGSLYGPAGTSDIAMTATSLCKPVVALCETINFDRDRVATDSVTYNEIDPERCSEDSFRLMFDTTRDKFVNIVVTEYEDAGGVSPSQAIVAILRKQEDPN